jgi:hypothetical protein
MWQPAEPYCPRGLESVSRPRATACVGVTMRRSSPNALQRAGPSQWAMSRRREAASSVRAQSRGTGSNGGSLDPPRRSTEWSTYATRRHAEQITRLSATLFSYRLPVWRWQRFRLRSTAAVLFHHSDWPATASTSQRSICCALASSVPSAKRAATRGRNSMEGGDERGGAKRASSARAPASRAGSSGGNLDATATGSPSFVGGMPACRSSSRFASSQSFCFQGGQG